MIRGSIHGRRIDRQSLGQTALLFRNAREPLPFRLHNRRLEAGFSAVAVEEDGIDDLTGSGGEPEGDVRNAEDRFDIRDLLLDETD
jgi:hypothetical protein